MCGQTLLFIVIAKGAIPLLNVHTQLARYTAHRLACSSATVSMESMQVVLDPYQEFYAQQVVQWIAILCVENHW